MIVKGIKETIETLLGKPREENPYALVAEFETPGEVLDAARALRKAGYRRFDVHSPFPIHGIEKAMGLGPSLVPWIVLGGGLTGCISGLALQIWINVFDYPLNISGKPFNSLPAFIPVTFELTILLSAFGAVGSIFVLNFLPMLYHPLFKIDRFNAATNDKFFVSIEARDKQFSEDGTRGLLEKLGARHVALVEP